MDKLKIDDLLTGGKTIYDAALRVVFYARVSTDKDSQINSLENQVGFFEDFIKNQKNWIYSGKYIDEGISGSSAQGRQGFLKMINDGISGNFDLIITKEISRFSRNTLDSIAYTRKLRQKGVGVLFLADNINTFEPDAELRLTIMSGIAQEEVRRLSERVKFGFKRAVENGVCLGAHITGYKKEKGKLTIDPTGEKIVKYIFEEYSGGRKGLKTIAAELEEMGFLGLKGKRLSYSTIRGIIQNPKYKGVYCGGKYKTADYRDKKPMRLPARDWIVTESQDIPAIVTEELWEKANAVLLNRGNKVKEKAGGFQNRYEFSGKIFCGHHGTAYHRAVYKSRGGNKEVWDCARYRLKGRQDGCDAPTVYTDEMKVLAGDALAVCLNNKDIIAKNIRKVYLAQGAEKYNLQQIRSHLEKLLRRREKLFELSAEGIINNREFYEEHKKLRLLIEEKETLLANVEKAGNKARLKPSETPRFIKAVVRKDENGPRGKGGKIEIYTDLFGDGISGDDHFISLREIGISQAQVSRLEKEAINKVKGKAQ